ncbi:MAG TPA: EamA family transporter [Bacteroidales bacterium]|nr:EamA family transporter [Bacteroidales bacterium]HCB62265.1 EamA family transporter [Bacteroidales bacterium]
MYLCAALKSNMKFSLRSYLELHFVVLLLGFTGILGKLISLPAPHLVVFRVFIAFVTLFLFLKIRKQNLVLTRKQIFSAISIGLVVAAHWTTFFYAIKLSNVSVALGLLGVGSLFTALLEPLILRQRFSWFDIVTGIFIIVGIYIIFRFESRYVEGIISAIVCYFLSSLFSVLNKKQQEKVHPSVLSMYEMLFAFIFALGALPFLMPEAFSNFWPGTSDLFYLILLGSICSAYAFTAAIRFMKEMSAFFVVLHINLEPVYAIILAYLIFGESEHMSVGFYAGASIIFAAVFIYPFLKKQKNINQS